MQTRRLIRVGRLSIFLLLFVPLLGLRSTSGQGTWPDTWPEELENYRKQAQTIDFMTGTNVTAHRIPFANREEFEKAWPFLLEVKSKGAPITLVRRNTENYGYKMLAGVWIIGPPTGAKFRTLKEGNFLLVGPPWPESAYLPTGILAEYVKLQDEMWVPCEEEDLMAVHARCDIVLVCDGHIVDLNRVEFPSDAPIIDKRFDE